MTDFVLGFAHDRDYAYLIRKDGRGPDGRGFNGVGGKVETGEAPADAMAREWTEETGLRSPAWVPNGWMSFGENLHRVALFSADVSSDPDLLEDHVGPHEFELETVEWADVFHAQSNVPPIHEFVPCCREALAMVRFSPGRKSTLVVPG